MRGKVIKADGAGTGVVNAGAADRPVVRISQLRHALQRPFLAFGSGTDPQLDAGGLRDIEYNFFATDFGAIGALVRELLCGAAGSRDAVQSGSAVACVDPLAVLRPDWQREGGLGCWPGGGGGGGS